MQRDSIKNLKDRTRVGTSLPDGKRPAQRRSGPPIGAHMSIAGGYHHSVHAAHRAGCDTVQLFTKNNNQWRARELTHEEVWRFAQSLRETGIDYPVAHDCYLINPASPDPALWQKSLNALSIEIARGEALGLRYLIIHPGSHLESSVEQGLRRAAQAIDEAHAQNSGARIEVLLEITAGQGSNLGHRVEHLERIFELVREPHRLGVCFDTCHAFAAGYALGTPGEYEATMRALDRTVGLRRIKAFHLNDSKRELGSRVDRHAHIGRGRMGLEPFRLLLNDPRFASIPMYLETPKERENGEDMDVINLRTLRELVGR
jgi:deoxyribonuclease-4